MDDIVKAALLKWPRVPSCTGWLALDARGDWYMRDDRIQACGPFPAVKGSRIDHEKLRGFIERNYQSDSTDPAGTTGGAAAWYFQNGPQRVYVELEAAPWVIGVRAAADGGWALDTHTGLAITAASACWLDEHGRLFLSTERGLGIVRSLDMDAAADAVEAGVWLPQERLFSEIVADHRVLLSPHAQR